MLDFFKRAKKNKIVKHSKLRGSRIVNSRARVGLNKKESRVDKKKRIARLVVVLFFIFIGAIVYAPFLRIKKISIISNERLDFVEKVNIESRRYLDGSMYGFLPNDNVLFFNKKDFRNQICKSLNCDRFEASIGVSGKLSVEVSEKKPSILIVSSGEYYYVDSAGYVMKSIKLEDQTYDLFLVDVGDSNQIVVGASVLDGNKISYIKKVFDVFDNISNEWQIVKASFRGEVYGYSEYNFYTSEGWYFILRDDYDVDERSKVLKAVLAEVIEDNFNLDYIDLRIKERVFYKEN